MLLEPWRGADDLGEAAIEVETLPDRREHANVGGCEHGVQRSVTSVTSRSGLVNSFVIHVVHPPPFLRAVPA
jgi:hypothetical protein